MIEKISFLIPGPPVAKGRARSVVRNSKRGLTVGHYTPEKTAKYENLVRLAAQIAMDGRNVLNGPVAIKLTAWLPIPKSYSKKRMAACLNGSERHVKRPDLDNIVKSVTDGCNEVVWRDDSQIVSITANKHYGETPGMEVIVFTINTENYDNGKTGN